MRTLTLVGATEGDSWIWDYRCGCGLRYRVAAAARGARFWPSTGASRFGPRPLAAGNGCVKCDAPLSLDGCAIRVDATQIESTDAAGKAPNGHPVLGVERDAETTYVRLQGEIDLYNASALRAALERECALRPTRVVVDLSAVESLDSTALHVLLDARKLRPDRHRLVLVAPTPAIQRTLARSRVDRVLTVRASFDALAWPDALAAAGVL